MRKPVDDPGKVVAEDVLGAIRRYAGVVSAHRGLLVELDAAIGDADHGENLHRGLRAAVERLEAGEEQTPGAVLMTVATTLISTVGGAAGPLYGTAFLRAATAAGDREELDDGAVVDLLDAALEGLRARGRADVGDKTMVDAWTPAVDAARAAVEAGRPLKGALRDAADAAGNGMHGTIPLVARKGRASYLGERSAGHRDPGATSSYLLFATLAGQDVDLTGERTTGPKPTNLAPGA